MTLRLWWNSFQAFLILDALSIKSSKYFNLNLVKKIISNLNDIKNILYELLRLEWLQIRIVLILNKKTQRNMSEKLPSKKIKPNQNLFDCLEVNSFYGKMLQSWKRLLKAQSCKLYNNKYMIASTQITNTETFTFIAVLVFKLLSL